MSVGKASLTPAMLAILTNESGVEAAKRSVTDTVNDHIDRLAQAQPDQLPGLLEELDIKVKRGPEITIQFGGAVYTEAKKLIDLEQSLGQRDMLGVVRSLKDKINIDRDLEITDLRVGSEFDLVITLVPKKKQGLI